MLSAKTGPIPGQSLTTAKTPSCWAAGSSRALCIASPVPIPARVSYAPKKSRKAPIPRRVVQAFARSKSAASSSTDSATIPVSTSWMTWNQANHVEASSRAETLYVRVRMEDLEDSQSQRRRQQQRATERQRQRPGRIGLVGRAVLNSLGRSATHGISTLLTLVACVRSAT